MIFGGGGGRFRLQVTGVHLPFSGFGSVDDLASVFCS